MSGSKRRFFLVREDLLPEAIVKTARAKEILLQGKATKVVEAVKRANLSRSAFYKYKDGVFPFYQWSPGVTVNLALVLEHRSGILSKVLSTLAATRVNILTINQNIPVHGLADVSITFETSDMEGGMDDITVRLQALKGVREVNLRGHNVG